MKNEKKKKNTNTDTHIAQQQTRIKSIRAEATPIIFTIYETNTFSYAARSK